MWIRQHTQLSALRLAASRFLKARRLPGEGVIVAGAGLFFILILAFSDLSASTPVEPVQEQPIAELNIGNAWHHAPLSGQQPAWYVAQ